MEKSAKVSLLNSLFAFVEEKKGKITSNIKRSMRGAERNLI